MTADRREVEDKYDLDESCVLPDFNTLRGVGSVSTADQELAATYFDTTDLALATAGVTLRRRTGGEDAGWHLKLPMSDGRLEIGLPLGRAVRNPPVALRTVVAGVVRGRSMAPVVTIRTERRVHRLHDTEGGVLAEVADDRVSAEPVTSDAPGLAPITWREAEVELVSGRPSLLEEASDLMTSVGARRSASPSKLVQALGDRLPPAEPVVKPRKKSPAADVIQVRLLRQAAVLRQLDPWVRHGAPEAVHDMRVTTRRLRHALASYRPFLDREQSEPLRAELGWLAALLGGPRDWEVLQQLLRSLVDDEPEGMTRGPVLARIEHDVQQRFDSARADLLSGMASRRYFDLMDRIESFAHEPPYTDTARKKARRVLPKSLDNDWKRLRGRVRLSAGQATGTVAGAEDLHRVRKAAKRVRYAAEALVPLYGKEAERWVTAHERIQTVLGDHHDDAEAEAALVELADSAAAAGENAFTFGVLHARLESRCAVHAADFENAWQRSVSVRDRHRLG